MKLVKILLVLLILFLIAAAGMFFFLKRQVTETMSPQGIVSLLEERYNLRAEVGGVDTTLEGLRTKVVIRDLVLAPRDWDSDAGTAVSERGKLVPEKRVVFSELVEMDLDLSKLAKRQVEVGELVLTNLVLQVELNEGENNLVPLFDDPEMVNGKAVASKKSAPVQKLAQVDGETEKGEEKEDEEDKPMKASDIPLRITAGRVAAVNASISVRDLASSNVYRFEETALELTNIDVDPAALAEVNHLDLSFDTKLKMDDVKSEGTVMEFLISAEGDAVPFDVATGELNVSADLDLVLGQGSSLDGHPLLAKLGERLESVAKYGISVAELTAATTLSSDVRTRVTFIDSALTFKEDVLLPMERFSLGLKQGGWFNTAENNHEVGCVFIASSATTEKVMGEVKEYLNEKVGGALASIALSTVTSPLLNEEGNLELEFGSTGSLSDPSVTMDTALGGIGDSIQNVVKDLLKSEEGIGGLLKGLFNKD